VLPNDQVFEPQRLIAGAGDRRRLQGLRPGLHAFSTHHFVGQLLLCASEQAVLYHNIEQEAELVADRYMLWNSQNHLNPCNSATTFQQLQQVVPICFQIRKDGCARTIAGE
jgi:hypothetical protein